MKHHIRNVLRIKHEIDGIPENVLIVRQGKLIILSEF